VLLLIIPIEKEGQDGAGTYGKRDSSSGVQELKPKTRPKRTVAATQLQERKAQYVLASRRQAIFGRPDTKDFAQYSSPIRESSQKKRACGWGHVHRGHLPPWLT